MWGNYFNAPSFLQAKMHRMLAFKRTDLANNLKIQKNRDDVPKKSKIHLSVLHYRFFLARNMGRHNYDADRFLHDIYTYLPASALTFHGIVAVHGQ